MPKSSHLPHGQSAIVWTDATHEAEGMRLMLAMGDAIEPKAVGGPGSASWRPGQSTVVPLGLRGGDDLRAMVVTHKPRWILALTHEDVHPENLPLVDGQRATLITREPIATSGKDTGARVVLAGALLNTPGILALEKQLPKLSQAVCANLVSTGSGISLFARLLDAWESTLAFAPFPDSIHAALFGPLGKAPQDLGGLAGRISAHGVSPGEGSIHLLCADSGEEHRSLNLVSSKSHFYATPAQDGSQPTRADNILAQWQQLMLATKIKPGFSPEAVACCAACLLSIRTGSAESPKRLLEMGAGF